MKKFTQLLFCSVFILYSYNIYSQKSYGGLPLSFSNNDLTTSIDHVILTQPDMNQIMYEDSENNKNGGMHLVGRVIPVRFDMNNSGTWEELGDGTKVWRLKITCPEALSLTVLYKDFYLPQGSQLYLYNENRKQILGSYDHRTNPKFGPEFSTQMVQGETTYIEYISPVTVSEEAVIDIEGVIYNYRDVEQFVKAYEDLKSTDFGASGSCNVNVNCPEGNAWQTQKKGVAVMYVISGMQAGFCTGTLVNNTANDGKPYFLSADHCGGTSTSMNQWQFHFHFEAPACANPGTSPSVTNTTITGATMRARGPESGGTGTDFLLLELSTTREELASMNVYYNGWDRNTTASASGVGIHHPSGDIKKISTYTAALQTASYTGCLAGGHWRAQWVQTATNFGITEGGSSGSPIFNGNNKLVVGTLTGGASDCGVPAAQAYDLYGKFDIHWESNGSTNNLRLKPWLDPGNTGAMTCPGLDPNVTSLAPVANFSGSPVSVSVGGSVSFSDLSTNAPTSWLWTFDGGNPATSTQQNPTVQYNTAGNYTVSLKATNAQGDNTKTVTGYIVVSAAGSMVANFLASATEIMAGECINFEDRSSGNPTQWTWSFPGAAITSSTSRNPSNICYNMPGTYDVVLQISRGSENDTYRCRDCITVNPDPDAPIANFDADYYVIPVGGVVHFTNLSENGPIDQWAWEFQGGIPSTSSLENPTPVAYNTPGLYDVTLRVRRTNGRQGVQVKRGFIRVVAPGTVEPTADFAANYTVIRPGESVNFIDFSTGLPSRWNWTFDGAVPETSTRQHPRDVVYNNAGIYTVTLKVQNNIGTDSIAKEMYILVTDQDTCSSAPTVNFNANNRLIEQGGCIYFQNLSTGNPLYSMWEFQGGSPSYSTEGTPTEPICYEVPGIYKVKLTVSNQCGSAEFVKEKYVYVFSGLVGTYCDTITTVKSGEVVEPKANPVGTYGYIAGHSSQRIRNFANYFETHTFTEVEGLIIPVYRALNGAYNSWMEFYVWDAKDRRPHGDPIATKRVYLRDLSENQNNLIRFDSPAQISGPFFLGFRINYPDENNDNVSDDLFVGGIVTNRLSNDTINNTLFFLQSNIWKSTNEMYGFSTSLAIRPISCLVDVEQHLAEENIDVYPNPSTGLVNIKVTDENFKNFDVEIYDALGRRHDAKSSYQGLDEYSIDMSNYPKGIYIIKIVSGNVVVNKKLLLTN